MGECPAHKQSATERLASKVFHYQMHTPGQHTIPMTTHDARIHHLEHCAMTEGSIEAMADL